MKVLLALAMIVPVCLLVAFAVRTQARSERRVQQPVHDLATAVRLLDRASEADEVMPYMPSDTREEVRAFLRRYHGREIQ